MRRCTITAALILSLRSSASFAAPPEPPKLRLGDDIRPTRYRVDLTVIPENDAFSGTVEIELDIRKPVNVIWLNARTLTIERASLTSTNRTAAAKILNGGKEFAGFRFAKSIPAGKATLHIVYHGDFSKNGSGGLFKLQEGGNWYVYTQFEPVDARQAFPCFDEPGYKVPWQLSLHVKKEHVAVSNTPVLAEADEPNGRTKVTFAETQPLPSYLIALAVGPLEFADAGKAGSKSTPIRIVTPKGMRAQAKYATEVTSQILDRLETYFGIPYPYEKLDAIAVPLTFGFGAMENPGLITYAQNIILAHPSQDSIDRQRGYAETAAHEMAHQWFGDLVTTAWWNDIWLNEAFASWMSSKIIHQWKPEWNTKIGEQFTRIGAMDEDSLITARQIRQPIEAIDDIANAFDGITYSKGEAVIGMFEQWMGEAPFQRGVQRYLRQYSSRNATAGDFLDSLSSAGGPPVTAAFSTFLDQPGVPLISVALRCDATTSPILHLSQKRSLPLGSEGSSAQKWQIPVCVRYGEGDAAQRECTLLKDASQEWKLNAKACPTWVMANADGAGYYHVHYEGDLLHALLADRAKHLSAAERMAALGDVEAGAKMGLIKAGSALALTPEFANDPVRQVVRTTIDIAHAVESEHLVNEAMRPNYQRFIAKTFEPKARELGWNAQPSEGSERRLLRPPIVSLVATAGGDAALAAEARKLAERWIADRNAVDPDIVRAVLTTAAYSGDQALFDRLLAALTATQDRQQRSLILTALGSFRDRNIVASSLNLLLKPEVDLRESSALLFYPAASAETRDLPFEFVKKNYAALTAKMPAGTSFDWGAELPFVAGGFCDAKSREEAAAFFGPKMDQFIGGKRNLAQTLESIRLCEAYKIAQQASVTEFLQRY